MKFLHLGNDKTMGQDADKRDLSNMMLSIHGQFKTLPVLPHSTHGKIILGHGMGSVARTVYASAYGCGERGFFSRQRIDTLETIRGVSLAELEKQAAVGSLVFVNPLDLPDEISTAKEKAALDEDIDSIAFCSCLQILGEGAPQWISHCGLNETEALPGETFALLDRVSTQLHQLRRVTPTSSRVILLSLFAADGTQLQPTDIHAILTSFTQ